MMKNVSVIGLGKLGACMAATMAAKGMNVIGVDLNSKFVELINQGLAPVVEPGLEALIKANCSKLRATTSCKEAVLNSDVSFIIVPTPSDESGGFSIKYVKEAAREIGAALREKSSYHLVVLTSTVLPGGTQQSLLPLLEQASGKTCGKDFGLCYNPEFIALGSVIHDLTHPDFILIGESDEIAGDKLETWYQSYCENKPAVSRMNFVNAELTKISVNTYVTTKITFANMLANLCESLPGADIDTVSAALGLDSRIGRRYLTGALGYGGPCFPRDNKALSYSAAQVGLTMPLAEVTDKTNRDLLNKMAAKVRNALRPGMNVTVLGLAYKPDTNVVEESQGVALAKAISEHGIKTTVFDPVAMENAKTVLKDSVRYAPSLSAALEEADAVIVTIPCKEFQALTLEQLPKRHSPVKVFDCWRILRKKFQNLEAIDYIPLGVGNLLETAAQVLAQGAA